MHRPARRHPEFEPARPCDYPPHLREAIAEMPCAPGVYIFHGEESRSPLYIGKSVSLRTRVLSHLCNPQEAHLLRQTRRISCIRTAGEIGALLLEEQLIKLQQPSLNQKLRRSRQLCSFRLPGEGRPELVYSSDIDFVTEPALYGLFGSRHAALEALRDLADRLRLCYGALGLEKQHLAGRAFAPRCTSAPASAGARKVWRPTSAACWTAWPRCAWCAGPTRAPSHWSRLTALSDSFTSSVTGITWASPAMKHRPDSSVRQSSA